MSLPLELITTLLLLSVLSALLYFFLAPRYTSLPPGPPRTFFGFGGNKIPPYNWRYFDGLTKEYGPVCTVWLGRTPLVVVGGYAAAMELLEKKAGVTADRPRVSTRWEGSPECDTRIHLYSWDGSAVRAGRRISFGW